MKLLDSLLNSFPLKDASSLVREEKVTTLKISYETNLKAPVQIDFVKEIIDQIHENDSWSINIDIENYDPISLGRNKQDIPNFVLTLNNSRKTIEDERIKLKILITKNFEGNINIYDFSLFEIFATDIGPVSFLKIINPTLKKYGRLYFNLLDSSFEGFYSSHIYFGKYFDHEEKESYCDLAKVRENCHFGNQDEYPYSPFYFKLIKRPEATNYFVEILDSLSFIFSIVCIFDITAITDKTLYYKLNGYKTFEGKLDYNRLPLSSAINYLRIFEWIYSENSNISDKIGLARNILSIYLKSDSLEITESVYYSLQSGFKTYLQQNLNRYIDIRNKIGDQLLVLTNRANSVLDDYLNKYQKNSLTFVTFFISVLLIRVLITGQFTDVFTKDATIIAFAVLAISGMYMIFSLIHSNSEKKRIIEKYAFLKQRFQDLLIQEDIDKILNYDKEFNDDIKYFEKRRSSYTVMWIATIVIFFLAVVSLSTHYNWHNFFSAIGKFP